MKIHLSSVKVLGITLTLCLAFWSCSRQDASSQKSENKDIPKTATESRTAEMPQVGGAPPRSGPSPSSQSSQSSPQSTSELAPAQSQPVEIEGVSLDPGSPITGDSMKAVVAAAGGGKDEKTFSYCWKVNGQTVQDSPSDVLDSPVKRGDFVEVEVKSGSGDIPGKFVTRYTKVCNAPPVLSLVGQEMGNDGKYEARVEASDPEHDPVTFSLKSGPAGMSVDAATGKIFWMMSADAQGTYSVQVSAKDSEGAETLLNYQIKIRRESSGRN